MRAFVLCAVVLVVLAAFLQGCSTTITIEVTPGGDGSADAGRSGSDGGDARGPHPDGGPSDAGDGFADGGGDVVTGLTVGGTVKGLTGKGLILENDGFDELPIATDGPFTFPTQFSTGGTYAVTVLDQPGAPAQTCSVSRGSGTFAASNVTSVVVTCSTREFTIGGSLSGLSGTVVLRDNGGDDLTRSTDGPFTFSTPVASGSPYSVTVHKNPATETCTVAKGGGVVGSANVTSVAVTCNARTYTVGGKVSGLTGSGLVLQNNGGDDHPITKNGGFTFSTPIANGSMYAVTVSSQPSGQYCVVTSGTGTLAGANVTKVDVACAAASLYAVGGMVTGLLAGDSVVLQDNLADDLTVSTNGSFTFATSILQGRAYSVTVLTQPSTPILYCSVSSGSGTVTTGDVTSVVVTCSTTGCGRFTSGYTGSWSTAAANPFGAGMGLSGYLPAGGTATIYVNGGSSLDAYSTGTNTYAPLASPPVPIATYGSTAWLGGALWSVAAGFVTRYDLTAGTWSTAATGLSTSADNQTASDDSGNVWSYSNESTLLAYNVASGTTTYPALSNPLTGFSEPRISFDSCSGLFYLADYGSTFFYSYDPTSGIQTSLSSLPAANEFQDGFCGDRSGHIFAVTNTSTTYQYTISTGVWTAMPSGGPTGTSNSACGVGADGFLYATDPATSAMMYRIQLN